MKAAQVIPKGKPRNVGILEQMRFLLQLSTAALCLLLGCAGHQLEASSTPAPVASSPTVGTVLPTPPLDPGHTAVPRSGSATDLPFNSTDVFDFTDNGNSGPNGETFLIVPGDEDELAWAIFRLQLVADDRPVTIDLSAATAQFPGGEENLELSYWLTAHSFSQQRWIWIAPPPASADPVRPGAWNASGDVEVGLNSNELRERFCNLGGEVYFGVLVERKSRTGGVQCGVTIGPSTLHPLAKSDPAFFRTAPLGSGPGAAASDGQNNAINVQVEPDPEDEADRIYVQRRPASGTSSLRASSTAPDWVELGFTDGGGGTYSDPGDNINGMAGAPQEGVSYLYRTVAAILDGNQTFRAAPSSPVAGGFGWTAITVDDPGSANVGLYTSMAVVGGRPAIAYADATNSRVLYIRANDAEGTDWPSAPSIVWPPGGGIGGVSLALVGSTPPLIPAIAFYDFATQQLNYSLAFDEFGNSWRPPLTVDSTVDAGHDCDMKMIGGVPCIAYADGGNGLDRALRFVRAVDPFGGSWLAPEVVHTVNQPGKNVQDPSLAEVANEPAIAFYDATTQCVAYVRFDGSLWTTPKFLAGNGALSCNPQLIRNNGAPPVPLICFTLPTGGPYCIVATDTQGGGIWSGPFQLDPGGSPAEFCSMSLVNGKPAVAYRRGGQELCFVESGTPNGQDGDWGVPKVLDGNGGEFVGKYCSLGDLNGLPAISYYGDTTAILRYARRR